MKLCRIKWYFIQMNMSFLCRKGYWRDWENSKKTIENSFLKKYASLLEKGQCDDFLKMCAEKYLLLYSKCLLSLKSIEEQLKSTTESNRIFLLKVARVLDKAIAEELEHDLRSQ